MALELTKEEALTTDRALDLVLSHCHRSHRVACSDREKKLWMSKIEQINTIREKLYDTHRPE
jgi:hypothetical protein